VSNARDKHAGISPELAGLAGAVGGAAVGYMAAGLVLRKPGLISGIGKLTAAAFAAAGLGNVASKKVEAAHAQAMPQQSAFTTMPDFSGFSAALPLTAQSKAAFFEYADHVGVSGKYGALQCIVQELATHGQPKHAELLQHHFAQHASEPFYRRLDAWLSDIGERSPETLMHVERQAVLLALVTDSVYQGQPNYDQLVTRAMIAGMAHDIGKIAVAPELLHKATRIDSGALETFLAEYQAKVPDYPEKAQHMEFLRMLNGGRISISGKATDGTLSVSEVIAKVNAQPLLGEPQFADAALKASNQKIYHDIQAKAVSAGMHWITPAWEAALLNHGRRGTLTKAEATIMASHDNLGVEMLARAELPAHLGISPAVIDMDKQGAAANLPPDLAKLQQWIMLSDVFEATTGQRAYNRENGKNLTPSEAIQVLKAEAARGPLKPETVETFETLKLAERYAAFYPDIPQTRSMHTPQPVIQAAQAKEAALQPEQAAQAMTA